MGLKNIGCGLLLVATVGAGVEVRNFINNDPPDLLLPPITLDNYTEVQPTETGQPTIVCSGEYSPEKPCDVRSALGYLAAGEISKPLEYKDINDYVKIALFSAEDRKFLVTNPEYVDQQHKGVDDPALLRALYQNIVGKISGKKVRKGGSTLTMDYGEKLFSIGKPKNDWDKLIEMKIAVLLEEKYSKTEILTGYLNLEPFGRGAIGLQAAAQAYFGKDARDLTFPEAIWLVGALHTPSKVDFTYDPNGSEAEKQASLQKELKAGKENYIRVLDGIRKNKYDLFTLTDEQYNEFLNAKINVIDYGQLERGLNLNGSKAIDAQHYTNMAFTEAERLTGLTYDQLANGGYIIYTRLNTSYQKAAANVINFADSSPDGYQAAMTAIQKDGAVVAMVGGRDFSKSQVNLASGAGGGGTGKGGGGSGRNAGSSLKGFILAAAYESGVTPFDRYKIGPSFKLVKANSGEDWTLDSGVGCNSLGRDVPCEMTVEEMTRVSSNIGFLQLLGGMGVAPAYGADRAVEIAKGLGLDYHGDPVASMVVGSGDISTFGAATANLNMEINEGSYVEPYVIRAIYKRGDPNPVYLHNPSAPHLVVSPEIARKVTQTLRQPIEQPGGTAYGAFNTPPNTAVGKTGTAPRNTDLWFSGAVCDIEIGGVAYSFWIGYPDSNKKSLPKGITSHNAAALAGAFVAGAGLGADGCQFALAG